MIRPNLGLSQYFDAAVSQLSLDIADGIGVLGNKLLGGSAVRHRFWRLPATGENDLRPECLDLCRCFSQESRIELIARGEAFCQVNRHSRRAIGKVRDIARCANSIETSVWEM